MVVTGVGDGGTIVGHYFNPLKGVKAIDSASGKDITSYLEVFGSVDYGTVGTYQLVYKASYNGKTYSHTRNVQIDEGTYSAPKRTKSYITSSSLSVGSGSVRTGNAPDIEHVKFAPNYIAGDLMDRPLPTNNWWGTLISQNYGGGQYSSGGNGIYTNYTRNAFSSQGLEVTNDGEGFVEYMSTPLNESTAAVHCPFYQDMFIKPTNLSSSYQTQVIDYGENNVKVACRNGNENTQDEMVVSFAQGSPFTLIESRTKNLQATFRVPGIIGAYNWYSLDGKLITKDTPYSGSSVLLELAGDHVAYAQTGQWSKAIGGAIYKNVYFLFSASKLTTFAPVHGDHPSDIMLNKLNVTLGSGNYMTVAPITGNPEAANTLVPALAEANYFAAHAPSVIAGSQTSFEVNHETSVVTTSFRDNVQHLDKDSTADSLLALMPHQYKKSDAALTQYYHKGFKGTFKVMEKKESAPEPIEVRGFLIIGESTGPVNSTK